MKMLNRRATPLGTGPVAGVGFQQFREYQDGRYARVDDLERLMRFGRGLVDAVTLEAMKPVLWEFLPAFGASRDCWILLRSGDQWNMLLGAPADDATHDRYEALAERAILHGATGTARVDGILFDDHVCYPIVASGAALGVLGIPAARMTSHAARQRIAAVTALIAIAVKNAQLHEQSQDKGMRDGLTGCFNRGYAIELVNVELRRARRSHLAVSVLAFDIDHFKDINDRYGHAAGDHVLLMVTQQLQSMLRASDIKCRLGGDEFLVILPDTGMAGSSRVAENVRVAIGNAVVPSFNHVRVTISTGVATADAGEVDVAALLARADAALSVARQAGRNHVATALDSRE